MLYTTRTPRAGIFPVIGDAGPDYTASRSIVREATTRGRQVDSMPVIHIDPQGGIAGDMFAAAVTDAFPQFESRVVDSVASMRLADTTVAFTPHEDGLFRGRRFAVTSAAASHASLHHHHDHHDHDHHHHHTSFADIRKRIVAATLPDGVKEVAVGIFSLLAEAESYVHKVAVDAVAFHEVGAWDSIADIIAAAALIDALRSHRWTVGVLPLGGGRIQTEHGLMSVPAPATTRLMEGFDVVDDGVSGERVTPTGMAILAFLRRHTRAAEARGRLERCGVGFGSRVLPGISNVLRVLVMADADAVTVRTTIAQLTFDVDDQTSEDLALALDRLAGMPGVVSLVQIPVVGKKGRLACQVQILTTTDHVDSVAEACLVETRTLGLRVAKLDRVEVRRATHEVESGGRRATVKISERPDGVRTAKMEAEELAIVAGAAQRDGIRQQAERAALRVEDKADAQR